ncbi:MAG: virulence factor [Candidatus Nanopelagicales bacterium]
MAEYQITYWRDFPSMVVARSGEETVKVSLASRFQEAIDEAAMRLDAADADAYLDGWIRSDWTPADGEPAELAERISAELENTLDETALQAMLEKLS